MLSIKGIFTKTFNPSPEGLRNDEKVYLSEFILSLTESKSCTPSKSKQTNPEGVFKFEFDLLEKTPEKVT